jgi:hypothetical protein
MEPENERDTGDRNTGVDEITGIPPDNHGAVLGDPGGDPTATDLTEGGTGTGLDFGGDDIGGAGGAGGGMVDRVGGVGTTGGVSSGTLGGSSVGSDLPPPAKDDVDQ